MEFHLSSLGRVGWGFDDSRTAFTGLTPSQLLALKQLVIFREDDNKTVHIDVLHKSVNDDPAISLVEPPLNSTTEKVTADLVKLEQRGLVETSADDVWNLTERGYSTTLMHTGIAWLAFAHEAEKKVLENAFSPIAQRPPVLGAIEDKIFQIADHWLGDPKRNAISIQVLSKGGLLFSAYFLYKAWSVFTSDPSSDLPLASLGQQSFSYGMFLALGVSASVIGFIVQLDQKPNPDYKT